ncbi:GNAT family N-acetyltransferase [Ornithinimicrobium sp. F0845]|uniref:GNAT family N-acetyltransferase n=1 Tax=Ornithinimicrobium sp. F0845 TaxID=2926412 RepID=UPI001FF13CB5|nr:GNAT family N-acetyltransferase [Ornithinimicrobium sp. F0845]MCK0111162.1 GNAT family N-acetyltransferase [Ornithinimicrobium sp. F0845]
MTTSLAISTATRDDLDTMVEWAAAEGWNPGLDDAGAFFAADPEGFLVGRIDGEPIGCISVVGYPPAFGFLGFYIVTPQHRGQGHGLALWRAGMERLRGRIVGLDGVVDQQPNYRRSGFVLAHRNIRFGGAVRVPAPQDGRLRDLTAELVEAVLQYDAGFFPADRSSFVRGWLTPERRRALVLVEDGEVRGYGVVRTCRQGAKIGPLFADTDEGADLLFRSLAARAPGEVFLDCPEPNAAATNLATTYCLSPVFETARMYRGPAPELPLSRTYGITTFELG